MKRLASLLLVILLGVFIATGAIGETRVLFGTVDYQGNILTGNGFTVTGLSCGAATCKADVVFNTAFPGYPTCVVSAYQGPGWAIWNAIVSLEVTENYYMRVFMTYPSCDAIPMGFSFTCTY